MTTDAVLLNANVLIAVHFEDHFHFAIADALRNPVGDFRRRTQDATTRCGRTPPSVNVYPEAKCGDVSCSRGWASTLRVPAQLIPRKALQRKGPSASRSVQSRTQLTNETCLKDIGPGGPFRD